MVINLKIFILEADQQEQINKAQGEANALLAVAEAKAKGIRLIADALKQTVKYIELFIYLFIIHKELECYFNVIIHKCSNYNIMNKKILYLLHSIV